MLLRDLVCTIPNSQYMKTNDAPFFIGDADELKKGEHWVTVSKEGGNPRRILLNGKGEIVGGDVPKEQQGKKIDKAAKEDKPSNKKEEVVKSKEFKNWFKKSKVVNNQEEPLVVYHGSEHDIEAFDKNKAGSRLDSGDWGKGFYFGKQDMAEAYGRHSKEEGKEWKVKPYYISLQNPLEIKGDRNSEEINKDHPLIPLFKKMFGEKVINEAIKRGEEYGEGLTDFIKGTIGSEEFTKTLQKNGYDGVIRTYKNNQFEVVAFEPEQIKSVKNKGSFNPDNPSVKDKED